MSGLSIRPSVQNGVAVINVLNGNTTLAFLGASCPASVLPGNDGLSSVTLSPNKGEEAVVALTTFCRYGGRNPDVAAGGLVRLSWEGDKLFVDTDKPFISPADRLGQVVPNGRILQITTQGQTFAMSTAEDRYRKMYEDPLTVRGVRIVNDANLLCRYLVGQATFEELTAAASGDLRTAEQIRIAELEKSLNSERERSLAMAGSLEDHLGEIDILSDELRKVRGVVISLKEDSTSFNAWLEKALLEKRAAEARYVDAWERVQLLENQLNRTLGARWQRFRAKVFPCRLFRA